MSATDNSAKENLPSFYFETRFRLGAADPAWPDTFAIVSAYATTGERWTERENESADQELAADIQMRSVWHCRLVAYSPTSGHTEPSWAIQLAFDEACDLGLAYKQDAIYWVERGQLFVSKCEPSARVRVGVNTFEARIEN